MQKLLIFIHGLGGSPHGTWKDFPKLINEDKQLQHYDVEHYGYPTSFLGFRYLFNKCPTIPELARGLKTHLDYKYNNYDDISLICHSLGGLIGKQYLIDCVKYGDNCKVNKIILYATPNLGSEIANWGDLFLNPLLTRQAKQLSNNSEFIQAFNTDWNRLDMSSIQVKYVIGLQDKVVNYLSGTSGGLKSVPISDKNHRSLVKPISDEDLPYLICKQFLLDKKKLSQKQTYKINPNYIPRSLSSDSSPSHFFNKGESSIDLIDSHKKIVILSDAGCGKSEELMHIASNFSQKEDSLFPFFLKLNQYIGGDVCEYIPIEWIEIPEDQRLFIFDGLNEVESKYKNDIRRSIERLIEQSTSSYFIVSCRCNFYNIKTDNISGTLMGFEEYYIMVLSPGEFTAYAKSRLGDKSEDFIDQAFDSELTDYLAIPFYLVNLIEIYKTNTSLPKNKAEVIEEFILLRLSFDIEHFRHTDAGEDLRERKSEVIHSLSELALGMETLGRNYINKEEFETLVSKERIRKLLHYGTLLKANNKGSERESWQFEHNNFQEYLAAKSLSGQDLVTILSFIRIDGKSKFIPSWGNTINFLLSIKKDDDLLKWLLEYAPEFVVKSERDKLLEEQRETAFKNIFNKAKEKRIWIRDDNFSTRDFARFGESTGIIKFLIEQDGSNAHYTTLIEATSLLGEMQIPTELKDKVIDIFLKYALDKKKRESVQYRAMIALSKQPSFLTKEIINQITDSLGTAEKSYIRAGMYAMINASEYIDEFINIYIEGIQYVKDSYKSNRDNLVNERWNLWEGFSSVKDKGLKKLFAFLVNNSDDFMQTFSYKEEKIDTIIVNAANYYEKDKTIFDDIYNLLSVRRRHYLHSIHLAPFFVNTETAEKAINKIFEQDKFNWDSITDIAALSNTTTFNKICSEYPSDRINDNVIQSFLSDLKNQDKEKYKEFYEKINQTTDNHFFSEDIDPKEREKNQHRKDFDILFDKNAYLAEIKKIFEYADANELSYDEFIDLAWRKENDLPKAILQRLELLALHTGEKGRKNKITKEFAVKYYENNWNIFSIETIYNVLQGENAPETTQEQQKYIQKYYYDNITKVNFRTALTSNNEGKTSIVSLALFLHFFLIKFHFKTDKEILLDMLHFDYPTLNTPWIGLEYPEKYLSFEEVKDRIISNLQENLSMNPIAFNNHILFCIKHKLLFAIDIASTKLKEENFYEPTRITCLEAVCELATNWQKILEESLLDVSDYFKWNIIDKLLDVKSEVCENLLLEISKNPKGEKELYKSVEKLLRISSMEGLEKFTDIVSEANGIPGAIHYSEYEFLYETLDVLPCYFELLKLTYSDSFKDHEFRTLRSKITNALVTLGAKNKKYLEKIKGSIEEFIKKNKDVEDINFLNICIEQMENQFYMENGPAFTIEDAKKKINPLFDKLK